MSVKIGQKAYTLIACAQTWQGYASCFNKTQLVGSLGVLASDTLTAQAARKHLPCFRASNTVLFNPWVAVLFDWVADRFSCVKIKSFWL